MAQMLDRILDYCVMPIVCGVLIAVAIGLVTGDVQLRVQ